jgi:hypothetical protein
VPKRRFAPLPDSLVHVSPWPVTVVGSTWLAVEQPVMNAIWSAFACGVQSVVPV